MTERNKTMALLCKGCNEIFAIPARRGRPPQFCTACAAKDEHGTLTSAIQMEKRAERLISANERVDRLEMMLKSRGQHISQHRERYPWST